MARPIKILSHRIVTSPSEVPEIYTRVGFRLENEHPPRTPELAPRDRLGSERPVPRPARTPRSSRGRSRRCPCAENHRTEGMGRATPPRPASGRPVGDPRQLRLRVVPPEVRRDALAAARPRRPGPHKKDAAGRQSGEPLPPSVLGAIERGAEFSLQRRLFREGPTPSRPWFRLHYPVHYYYDILVGLDVLTSLGYGNDPRMGPALDRLGAMRNRDGSWNMGALHPDTEDPGYQFRGPFYPLGLEVPGRPSRWITTTALTVLKRAGREA